MEIKKINPQEIVTSTMNERKFVEGVHKPSKGSLQRSVENIGVVQPPLVRMRDDGRYETIVGQRRTIAAQQAGLSEIPVIVVDWDDAKSLAASIAENVSDFREKVTPKDRAMATLRLFELRDLDVDNYQDVHEVARLLGVHPRTIHNWLECVRDEWSGTPVHVRGRKDTDELSKLAIDKLQTARRVTGGGDRGINFLKQVQSHDLSTEEVREVGRKVNQGYRIDEAIDAVSAEKSRKAKKRLVVALDEELYEDLDDYSRRIGTTCEKAMVYAVEQLLYEE